MRRKFLATIALSTFLASGGYLGGVAVTALYVDDGINQALESFNTQLHHKYVQGILPYRLSTDYTIKKSGFFKSSGSLHLRNLTSHEEIVLPVEIKHRFLAGVANIDIQRIVNNLLVYPNILKGDVASNARLKFRLFPSKFEVKANIYGNYDSSFIMSDPMNLSYFSKRQLEGHLSFSQKNGEHIESSLDVHNLALPRVTAKHLYAVSSATLDEKSPQSTMTLGAEALYAFDSPLENIDNFKLKFDTTVPDHKDHFKIKYAVDMQTRKGKINSKGSLGPLDYKVLSNRSLGALTLNDIFAKNNITFKMDDLNFDINYANAYKHISFLGKAHGSIDFPAADNLIFVLLGAKGRFDVTLEQVSPDVMPYIEFYEKQGDAYHALISIDSGIIKVNDHSIYF